MNDQLDRLGHAAAEAIRDRTPQRPTPEWARDRRPVSRPATRRRAAVAVTAAAAVLVALTFGADVLDVLPAGGPPLLGAPDVSIDDAPTRQPPDQPRRPATGPADDRRAWVEEVCVPATGQPERCEGFALEVWANVHRDDPNPADAIAENYRRPDVCEGTSDSEEGLAFCQGLADHYRDSGTTGEPSCEEVIARDRAPGGSVAVSDLERERCGLLPGWATDADVDLIENPSCQQAQAVEGYRAKVLIEACERWPTVPAPGTYPSEADYIWWDRGRPAPLPIEAYPGVRTCQEVLAADRAGEPVSGWDLDRCDGR
jgi:hypothetical protein